MNRTQHFEESIRSLFKENKTFDLEYFSILDHLDFPALLQSIRHHAETVYTYKINAVEGAGRDYRSAPLFPERATQLYSCLATFSESELGVVRMLELWMLPDDTFAVVANMEIVIGDGAIVSEYRTVKTRELSEMSGEISINLTDLAKNLRDMSQDFINAALPCYEL